MESLSFFFNIFTYGIKDSFSKDKNVYHKVSGDDFFHETLKKYLANKENKKIFILGPWGSGKTAKLNQFRELHKESFNFVYRNYFGVDSLNQLYIATISRPFRFILVVLIGCLFFYFKKTDTPPYLVATAVISFFVINPNKLAYYLENLLSNFFCCKENNVIIIEDLDRSSVQFQDQMGFLSQLWLPQRQYIITYGYNNDEEKFKLIEMANKLEAKTIVIHNNGDAIAQIAKSYAPWFPFNGGEWLELFSIRDVLKMIDRISMKSDENEEIKALRLFREMYSRLIEILSKVVEKNDENNNLNIIKLHLDTENSKVFLGYGMINLPLKVKFAIGSINNSIMNEFGKVCLNYLPVLFVNSDQLKPSKKDISMLIDKDQDAFDKNIEKVKEEIAKREKNENTQ